MNREEANEWAADAEVELEFADGFDAALIGIGEQSNKYFVCYDRERCIKILIDQGMDRLGAAKLIESNVARTYLGPRTPAFIIQ